MNDFKPIQDLSYPWRVIMRRWYKIQTNWLGRVGIKIIVDVDDAVLDRRRVFLPVAK